jgi:hypothetical protein
MELWQSWRLIPTGIILGATFLWAFGRLSNQKAIEDTKRRLHARLYELRLFVDEPKLIWRAQIDLLRDNLRYIGLMLKPAAILAIPTLLMFGQFDGFFGLSPLRPGRSGIITVQFTRPLDPSGPAAVLSVPNSFVIEAPPVRILDKNQISWRVRPRLPTAGELRITLDRVSATKSIVAGTGPHYLSKRRVSSFLDLVRYPTESPITTPGIAWIEVDYPGNGITWLIWLLVVSMATALLLRRRFGVQV